ncbi:MULTISPECIES: plastocyanin/azurin family copper-binding protein [Halolamina]|uniref:Plastocyanin n=1 Tax=Halolamina pelagica TaxID=699431 RepID=A0A1I5MVB1_9EURY|nr:MULTISPECIES: plastocyanin/azurin family copper-binding protein [Halolamina]NHX36157.1 copper-binding protein [Halolamina sp. R1-12]SFP12981.1 Plastocyanin [Halolamina pelagica]
MTDDISRRRFAVALASTGIGIGLAGCGGGGGSTDSPTDTATPTESGGGGDGFEQTNTVDMTDELTFEPKQIEVEAGTTVTWENVGSIGHSATAYEDEIPDGAEYFASGGFDSEQAAVDAYPDEGNVTEGGTYEHTFETTGEYEYYCIPHEMNGMVGTVRVV